MPAPVSRSSFPVSPDALYFFSPPPFFLPSLLFAALGGERPPRQRRRQLLVLMTTAEASRCATSPRCFSSLLRNLFSLFFAERDQVGPSWKRRQGARAELPTLSYDEATSVSFSSVDCSFSLLTWSPERLLKQRCMKHAGRAKSRCCHRRGRNIACFSLGA